MRSADSASIYGYLQVENLSPQADDDVGNSGPWVGGYLLVTVTGRPLEFHCTAPVTASHAQQILYGKSLRRFLFGEHLGTSLVKRAKLRPSLLMISDSEAAAVGRAVAAPTVLLPTEEVAEAPFGATRLSELACEAWLLSRDSTVDEQQTVVEAVQQFATAVDLKEPFERIREAIGEAQQAIASADEQGAPRDVAA